MSEDIEAVGTYYEMCEVLADGFRNRYRRRDVNITGVLFARPVSAFTREHILPHIDYWHRRSRSTTDFFCPGYRSHNHRPKDVVGRVGDRDWTFDNEDIVRFLDEFEGRTGNWRYRGGCELLVTNARYDRDSDSASLDLSTAMVIDLDRAKEEKAIRDPTEFCEAVFSFAKNVNEAVDDPVWEFSDKVGMRVVKGSLKEFLLSYLPSWLQPEARKAFHFVAKDLRDVAAAY